MVNKTAVKLLAKHGLKITPQRVAILDVILALKQHPTADIICDYLRISYPHISIGTIYKTLEVFLSKGIINKVHSESDTTRYDGIAQKHHHLYCADPERIEDYYDDDLYKLVHDYLKKKKIPDFIIDDFKLQIIGRFTEKKISKYYTYVKKQKTDNSLRHTILRK